VVGDGTTTFTGLGGGNQEFDGAIFVASIKDTSGNLLSNWATSVSTSPEAAETVFTT